MKKLIFCVVSLAVLAACGGGGGSDGGGGGDENLPPSANISASAESGAAPLSIQFDAGQSNDSNGNITSFAWRFDDGEEKTGVTVTHTFLNASDEDVQRRVTLTVTDNEGATDTAEVTITVRPAALIGEGLSAPIAVDCRHTGNGIEYNIDPSQPVVNDGAVRNYLAIGDLDWASLAAGDTVRIHPRLNGQGDVIAYREKIGITSSGTADNPIRVCGVATPDGRLPYISGQGATERGATSAFDDGLEGASVVLIRGDGYNNYVEHIYVGGLHIADTHDGGKMRNDNNDRPETVPFSYTDFETGQAVEWGKGSACISIRKGSNITIEGNVISNCGNGLFTLSQTFAGRIHTVENVSVRGNFFHGNAIVNSGRQHQAYLQGSDFLVEFNYFGPMRISEAGEITVGSQLKMRSTEEAIRYNYFEGTRARALDMVEREDDPVTTLPWRYNRWRATTNSDLGDGCTHNTRSRSCISEDYARQQWEKYQNTYVYGNIFNFKSPHHPGSTIHYGFDNCTQSRRPGNLWFYHNTVSYRINIDEGRITQLFDMGAWVNGSCGSEPRSGEVNNEPGDPLGTYYIVDDVNYGPMLFNNPDEFARANAVNNVIYLSTRTPEGNRAAFGWTRHFADQAMIHKNWISEGWDLSRPGAGNSGTATCGTGIMPGFGRRCSDGDALYAGADDAHHVELSLTNPLVEGAPGEMPIHLPGQGSGDFAPVADGALKRAGNEAQPLDDLMIPADLRPAFQIRVDPAKPGTLVIEPRQALATMGAIE